MNGNIMFVSFIRPISRWLYSSLLSSLFFGSLLSSSYFIKYEFFSFTWMFIIVAGWARPPVILVVAGITLRSRGLAF